MWLRNVNDDLQLKLHVPVCIKDAAIIKIPMPSSIEALFKTLYVLKCFLWAFALSLLRDLVQNMVK